MIDLFRKYLDNRISAEELQALMQYLDRPENRNELRRMIQAELEEGKYPEQVTQLDRLMADLDNKVLGRVKVLAENEHGHKRKGLSPWRHWRTAAALALAGTIGLTIYLIRNGRDQMPSEAIHLADINPGGNRAILAIEGRGQIELDSREAGVAIRDGAVTYDGGQLVAKVNANAVVQHVSLSTPRGGQYRATLPDGSKVWLNAASSLRYPTDFVGDRRHVELSGEAYFEIIGDASKPFIVTSAGQQIRVLGTKFNVSAYPEEGSVATTLVEGAVRVSGAYGESATTLKPGHQAVFTNGTMAVRAVDTDYYTGWLSGRFLFDYEKLSVVFRHVERWYDVSFEYDEHISDFPMWGVLSRDVMLSELLEALSTNTGYRFERTGRKVRVFKVE